ncbi:hypothetical protein DL769_010591 [Monosporascus sp. CRB-8-3]|nr:hypothetical protein DL769_010591 [Monosporascus sp. CRB-8-3]
MESRTCAHDEHGVLDLTEQGLLSLQRHVHLCSSRIPADDDLVPKASPQWPNFQRVWKWGPDAHGYADVVEAAARDARLGPRIGGTPQREVPAHQVPRDGDA